MDFTQGTTTFTYGDVELTSWYRITGDLVPGGPLPLVVCHGGPGATHDYLLPLADLATSRPIIHYDQVGNGRSTHLPDQPEFFTVDLFVAELTHLVNHLGIAPRHAVLGQSWGGILAIAYALSKPPGLERLILANTLASVPTAIEEMNRLRSQLPAEVKQALDHHEAAGTTESEEYQRACDVFYRRHLCRLPEWPAEIVESFDWINRDPTVYATMNGPSEFSIIGTIRDLDYVDRLDQIDLPVLLLSGAHDEVTPKVQQQLLGGLPNASWHLFEHSAHMPHFEERELYLDIVGAFLRNEHPS